MTTQPRIPLDGLTSDALDALYDRLERAQRSAALHADAYRTADRRADALEAERNRYRLAWQSARQRAALYLQSNQNFAASIDNDHAAYLQLATEVARLTAGQCTHTRAMCGCGRPDPGACHPCPASHPSLRCACACELAKANP
ncbi:hypothetical protein [Streptomyces cyaneofuscatus]|uniref:hypothetical protein n=1 Tax=Streptomyces cyaneofuscatus TaxID=66883 RepID=UPI0036D953DF